MPVRDLEKQKETLVFTGERFLPWMEGAEMHYYHLHRYAFATCFVKGKKVLDIPCGEGYGANMLSKEADYVLGMDIDGQTIQHAKSKYTMKNLEFIKGSIVNIPLKGKFDVVICLEGIEHIAEYEEFLSEVKRVLKEDGLFIVSTPNKAIYTDEPHQHNPFHIKEFYLDEFKGLLGGYFNNVRLLGQMVYYNAGSNIWTLSPDGNTNYREFLIRKGDLEFHILESKLDGKSPLITIALATDIDLELPITDSWMLDVSKDSYIQTLNSSLQSIQNSIPIQVANRCLRIVDKILGKGTRRRHCYEFCLSIVRKMLGGK